MKTHELKTEPLYFQAIVDGHKKFEIRKNDRNFEEGDTLILKEYEQGVMYTGREVEVKALYITDYAQQPGYVVISIQKIGAMNDTELGDIEWRLSEITPGEWFRYHDEGAPMNILGVVENGQDRSIGEFNSDEDADFALHAPRDIRRLLDEVERLRKENETLRQPSGSEIIGWLGRQAKKFMRDVDEFDKEFEEMKQRNSERRKEMEESRKRFEERWEERKQGHRKHFGR